VRIAAMATLHTWLDTMPGEQSEQAAQDLLGTAQSGPTDEERGHAIQAIALAESRFSQSVIAKMAEILQTETCPENRALAAMAVAGCPPEIQKFALEQLESAYAREPELTIRRNIMTQIVRLAGSEALPVLERLDKSAPQLAYDAGDYKTILGQGVADFDEIYRRKAEEDERRGTVIPLESR
jgi:hypothetical protein